MRKQRRPRVSQSVNAGRCWCRKNCFESRCEQIIGGIPGISSLVAKCNERFILKKSASLKVMYDPVDLRISVSNKHQVWKGVVTKTWNDLKPPKTIYNHLQPPQKIQQPPTTIYIPPQKHLQSLSTTTVLFSHYNVHWDDQTQPSFEMTPGFKPFTKFNKTCWILWIHVL